MNEDLFTLVCQARGCGATFVLENDKILLRAPNPLPSSLVEALRNRKTELQQYLRKSQSDQESDNQVLEQWRCLSIPEWRRILHESIEGKNAKREEYARYMLREILEDPEYREDKP